MLAKANTIITVVRWSVVPFAQINLLVVDVTQNIDHASIFADIFGFLRDNSKSFMAISCFYTAYAMPKHLLLCSR